MRGRLYFSEISRRFVRSQGMPIWCTQSIAFVFLLIAFSTFSGQYCKYLLRYPQSMELRRSTELRWQ